MPSMTYDEQLAEVLGWTGPMIDRRAVDAALADFDPDSPQRARRAALQLLVRQRIETTDAGLQRALDGKIRVLEQDLGEPHLAWPERPHVPLAIDEYVDVA